MQSCMEHRIMYWWGRSNMKVHQMLPTLDVGDAIGNEAVLMRDLLRSWGYTSDIFAVHIHPDMEGRHYTEYEKESSADNLLIYHCAISSGLTDFIKSLPDKKIMIYHNITPPHFFSGINDEIGFNLEKGREELRSFVRDFDLALGCSEYNRYELEQIGYQNTGVLPLLIDYSIYSSWNQDLYDTYSDDWVNILFVGRISPNKKHEDIIKVFYHYKKINPKSRLFLPGGFGGCEQYFHSLQSLVQTLQLTDVYFPGKVPLEDLVSYYRVSDVFLCMSEHEGFNVPLVESMLFELPIIAYNTCAIPYTLGDAGVLVNKKKYLEIAELINIIVSNADIRQRLVTKQKDRLHKFGYDQTAAQFRHIIDMFIGVPGEMTQTYNKG